MVIGEDDAGELTPYTYQAVGPVAPFTTFLRLRPGTGASNRKASIFEFGVHVWQCVPEMHCIFA